MTRDDLIVEMCKAFLDERADPRSKGRDAEDTWAQWGERGRNREIISMRAAIAALERAGFVIARAI
jgi:hypothetical protein